MTLVLLLLSLLLLSVTGGPAHPPNTVFVSEADDSQNGNIEIAGTTPDNIPSTFRFNLDANTPGEIRADVNAMWSNETALCVPPCKSPDNTTRRKRTITGEDVLMVVNTAAAAANLIATAGNAICQGVTKFRVNVYGGVKDRLEEIDHLNKTIEDLTLKIEDLIPKIRSKEASLKHLKANITMVFNVFENSKVRADAVATTYKDLIMSLSIFKNLTKSEGNPVENITVSSDAVIGTSNAKIRMSAFKFDDNPLILQSDDVLAKITKFMMPLAGIGVMDLLKYTTTDAKSLSSSETWKEVFSILINLINAILQTLDALRCIHDNFYMQQKVDNEYEKLKFRRDTLREIYDNALIASRELDDVQQELENAVKVFNEQTDKLADLANSFFKGINTTCRTTPGTLTTDMKYLWKYVQYLKQEFDFEAELKIEKEKVQNMKQNLAGNDLDFYLRRMLPLDTRTTFIKVRSKLPNIETDSLINKMIEFGFSFPDEIWSEWKANSTCSCQTNDNETCMVKESRTCLRPGKCLGPKTRTTDKCATGIEDTINFFKKCENRDIGLRGRCVMASSNMTRDDGGALGRYVSKKVSQTECYEDCKKIPGAHGCEFTQTDCFLGECQGDCFVVGEEIGKGDDFPLAVCFKFNKTGCGIENFDPRRAEISGGSEAGPNQYPWMVRLTKNKKGWCGGSLITNRHVLTAKHCTDGFPLRSLKARVGAHNVRKSSDYQEFSIKKVVSPDQNVVGDHDIVIAILDRHVDLSNGKIGTVCLPFNTNQVYKGENAIGMGWGMTHLGSKQSPVLKHVNLRVSQKQRDNFLFTQVPDVDHVLQDPCSGDSGGPLVHQDVNTRRWTIIGTLNGEGYDCSTGNINGDGKWNKVTRHLSWIYDVIGNKI